MEIAIIADDTKKELITQLCIAYCGTLSKHSICATSTTGAYISEATGLKIEKLLSGTQGGDQQIASRISFARSFPICCISATTLLSILSRVKERTFDTRIDISR